MAFSSIPRQRPRAVASPFQVVQRAEAYLRRHADTRVSVARLCRIVGVSERRLRSAFADARGIAPHRFMVRDRLEAVRRALLAPGETPTTVTVIATNHGFSELGRFAAVYKQTFGESPSATLRAASTLSSPSAPRRSRS